LPNSKTHSVIHCLSHDWHSLGHFIHAMSVASSKFANLNWSLKMAEKVADKDAPLSIPKLFVDVDSKS
jgi:hypothetical protein